MAADPAKEAKFAGLVTSIVAAQAPRFGALDETLARMTVDIGAILARLELLEAAGGGGGAALPAAKRRVNDAGAAKKGGAKGKDAEAGAKSLTNAMLYLRHAMQHDLDGMRALYGTDANLTLAAANDKGTMKFGDSAEAGRAADESGFYYAAAA